MRIPHTISRNYFKEYKPSEVAQKLVPESMRKILSEDTTWDESLPQKLSELCIKAIVANFENNIILDSLPCWDRDYLLEILPTDLPLPLVITHIDDGIYWKRKVEDRWTEGINDVQSYDNNWKRMYLEKHVQEAAEAMTPKGFDVEEVKALCALARDYVKVLNLRELQIMEPNFAAQEDDEFADLTDPCDHIDLGPFIIGLPNLTELHIQFGLRNVGADYKKSLFEFSVLDCSNLAEGVANSTSLKLLRIHSSTLDDDKAIALLSGMEKNTTLEVLEFPNCRIGDDGANGVAKFLAAHETLKSLNLCNNFIREKGISALAFVLTQRNTCPLEELNLKFNTFGNEGCKFLASSLIREHNKIKVLNISCCKLGEEAGILMAEVLNRNDRLTNIDMSNNHLRDSAGRALKHALERNKTIQYLDLRMTEISNDSLSHIRDSLTYNRLVNLRNDYEIDKAKLLSDKKARLEKQQQRAAAFAKAVAKYRARRSTIRTDSRVLEKKKSVSVYTF